MRVLTVFGTRPEAIKLAPLLQEFAARGRAVESRVCVTGQHREMLDQVLHLFGVSPDYDLAVMRPGQSLAAITSEVLRGLDGILAKERFDWVLVQGDTTTCMTASLCAYYHKVKVGHVEAGLRTADKHQPFPEEINRRMTATLADAHFAPTQWAADNLRRENIPDRLIHITGNTGIDALRGALARPFDPAGTVLEALPPQGRVVLVTAHRRENFGQPIRDICAAVLDLLAEFPDLSIVYPVHLNPMIQEPVRELLAGQERVLLTPPLDYLPMVHLLQRSCLVLTDSGGLQEEAPGLGKPVLVLRNTTERPEGVEAGLVEVVGTDRRSVTAAARRLLADPAALAAMSRVVSPYGDGHAARRIADILITPAPCPA